MFERGESSRAAEEVQCRDVPVVSVQPYGPGRRPVIAPRFPDDPYQSEEEYQEVEHRRVLTAVPAVTDPDEEYRGRSSTPVRGGVTRFGGYTDSDDDEDDEDDEDGYDAGSEPDQGDADDAETDPDEDHMDVDLVPESEPEEAPVEAGPQDSPVFYQPGGFPDGMGSTADDIIEGMTEYQQDLEERVEHLELQNQIHQEREDQYRDLAYQTIGERDGLTVQLAVRDQTIVTLEGQVQLGQQSAVQTGSLIHQVVARSTSLSQQMEGAELEMAGLHEEVSALRAELDRERARRIQTEQALFQAERQTQRLGAELQHRDRRTDSLEDALTASLVRVRHRVYEQMARRGIRRAVHRRRD